MLTRRTLLLLPMAVALPAHTLPAHALPPRTLVFPRDFGSHPELRTEWWYITGHAETADGRGFGFQVTFFRSRVDVAQGLHSEFAARQLVFAHAALTDLQGRRLRHDQRIARAGFGIAQAAEDDTDLRLRDWTLLRNAGDGHYEARIAASDFTLALRFAPTQPLLLQGDAGLSRKGPDAAQASYYYSQPQLATEGEIGLPAQDGPRSGQTFAVRGRAWLDHEWSEALMHPEAVGWDWIGMNLQDGAALTAFQLRRQDGSALWAGGSWRGGGARADAPPRTFGADEVRLRPGAAWTSPHTQARYPTQWRLHTPAGDFSAHALLDDQELAASAVGGAVYWEGLSELRDAAGQRVGLGYLEMTGYAAPLRL